ncbi:hypothetical protein diail_7516 [Diaporthe ilicicola]|nr:hypothetical protein diail_7516 [Diaporthe ilicicola]
MARSANTHTAVKIGENGTIEAVAGEVPQLREEEVLIRVACVAINPVDGKSAELSPTTGATLGFDYSGEVIALGDGHAAKRLTRPLAIGDRVCGCVFGNNPDRHNNGAFAQTVAAPASHVLLIPSHMSFEEAATLGVGSATVGLALYRSLKLPLPSPSNAAQKPCPGSGARHVLVYGGSTATGTLAIQMIRLSGLIPIATCSPDKADLLKSLGAAAVFDYHSPTCGDDIREYSDNKLAHALDCVTDTASMRICYEALGQAGGQYLSLDPFPLRSHTRRSVRPSWILTLTIFDQPVNWKRPFRRDAQPQDRDFAAAWFQTAQKLLDAGEVKPHPFQVRTGGLKKVPEGIKAVRQGEVRGKKLVYRLG